jgi:hypothetical protein
MDFNYSHIWTLVGVCRAGLGMKLLGIALMKVLGTGLLGIVLLIAALCLHRVPQALLSRIFSNDYVYRLSVSVTVDGQTLTGETVAGCRVLRDWSPDWVLAIVSSRPWSIQQWAVALDVGLPGNRFLQLPAKAHCGPTTFRPEPIWKTMLGIAPNDIYVPTDDRIPALIPGQGTALLLDDRVAPRSAIGFDSKEAADGLGIKLSAVSISPSTWQQWKDHVNRRPGSPWLAPMTEQCVASETPIAKPALRPAPKNCFGGPIFAYRAHRYSLSDAMRVPEFATWAKSSDTTQIVAPVAPAEFYRARLGPGRRPFHKLAPDVPKDRWKLINATEDGPYHIVLGVRWLGNKDAPIVCLSDSLCDEVDIRRQVLVDWTAGEVLLLDNFGLSTIYHDFILGE